MPPNNAALAAECLVSVTGLYPSKPIRRGDVDEAIGVPKELARGISAFLSAESATKPVRSEKINYLATWNRLNEQQTDDALIGVLDNVEVGAAYLSKLEEARAYLRDNWHPMIIKTLMGDKLLTPSTSEEQRGRDLYHIVGDFRRMLGRLSSGCMMAEDIAAVRAVYPELSSILSQLIDAELIRRRIARKSFEVPYRQEVSIRLWAGLPTGAEIETLNSEGQLPQPEAPPEPQIETKTDRNMSSMTRADRVSDAAPA